MKYIAFMAHIPKTEFNYLVNTLKEYDIGEYLVGHENEPYSHYHFVVQMSEKDYHKYAKRVFKDKFNLRGRAIKDYPRQYGKIKKIADISKMQAYTLKEGDYRTNMSLEKINELIILSKQNTRKSTLEEELMNDLIKFDTPHMGDYDLQKRILRFYMNQETKVIITKSKLNNLLTKYKMFYKIHNYKIITDEYLENILGSLGINNF